MFPSCVGLKSFSKFGFNDLRVKIKVLRGPAQSKKATFFFLKYHPTLLYETVK